MSLTTTYAKSKSFAWSYSALTGYETCPKRYYHTKVSKDVVEPEGEALLWGNQVHAALEARVGKNTPLPASMVEYEPWAQKILAGDGATIITEQRLAIRQDFSACDWRDRQCWFRGKADVIKIMGQVALVVDYKTGKIIEDSCQLALMAACVFAMYPEVQAIRSEFIWLAHDASTREDFKREDMPKLWSLLLPRVKQLEHSHATETFPAKPGNLCKRFCPVKSCAHHGS